MLDFSRVLNLPRCSTGRESPPTFASMNVQSLGLSNVLINLFFQKKTFIKSRPQPVIIRVIIPFNSSCNLSYLIYFAANFCPPVHPITNKTARIRPTAFIRFSPWASPGNGLERQPRVTRFQDLTPHRQRPRDSRTTNFPQGLSGHVWPIVMGGFTYIRIYIRIPVIQGGMTIPFYEAPTPMYVWYTVSVTIPESSRSVKNVCIFCQKKKPNQKAEFLLFTYLGDPGIPFITKWPNVFTLTKINPWRSRISLGNL